MTRTEFLNSKTYNLVVVGICATILFVSQIIFAFLPNIELVSLFVILFTIHFKWKTLYSIYIFVLLEGMVYGFSIWFAAYLYIWTILFFAVYFIGKHTDSPPVFAVVSAIFGILFGLLTCIPYLFIGGVAAAVSYIVSGIGFDIIHCAGNFLTTLILFKPLGKCLTKLNSTKKREPT